MSAEKALFLGNGGSLTTVADSTGPYTQFTPFYSINSSDVVAFTARPIGGTLGIVLGDGVTLTTLYDSSGPFSIGGYSTVNDVGEVAFVAALGPALSDVALFKGDGGTPTLIADASGPFNGNFGAPDVNNEGTVAFWAELDSGEQGVFTGAGGTVTTVADSTGAFPPPAASDYFRFPQINSAGEVAFELGAGEGIYTGGDPLLDKVIAPGDLLFGSTVVRAFLGGHGHSLLFS